MENKSRYLKLIAVVFIGSVLASCGKVDNKSDRNSDSSKPVQISEPEQAKTNDLFAQTEQLQKLVDTLSGDKSGFKKQIDDLQKQLSFANADKNKIQVQINELQKQINTQLNKEYLDKKLGFLLSPSESIRVENEVYSNGASETFMSSNEAEIISIIAARIAIRETDLVISPAMREYQDTQKTPFISKALKVEAQRTTQIAAYARGIASKWSDASLHAKKGVAKAAEATNLVKDLNVAFNVSTGLTPAQLISSALTVEESSLVEKDAFVKGANETFKNSNEAVTMSIIAARIAIREADSVISPAIKEYPQKSAYVSMFLKVTAQRVAQMAAYSQGIASKWPAAKEHASNGLEAAKRASEDVKLLK